jgi:ribonuclease HIII
LNDIQTVVLTLREQCTNDGIEIVEIRDIAYGQQIKVRFNGQTGQINVYAGKKSLSILVQAKGDLANRLNVVKDRALEVLSEECALSLPDNEADCLPEVFDEPWIGIDESGKGDFFGPLVCVGVVVKPTDISVLREFGVADSKTLSETKIKTISHDLRLVLRDRIKTLVLKPATYNDLYDKFGDESKNLNSLLAWAHSAVLKDLLKHHSIKIAVSDKFANDRYILERTRTIHQNLHLIQKPNAERNLAVASASIIARSLLDKWFIEAAEQYKMRFPKGASLQVIEAGREFVNRFGFDKLREVAKLHFRTLDYLRSR